FILERNMHFVVANIVTPLTQSKGVSFVTLWGGRRVDYFVSHSWGTSFPHFVNSIQCHALSKEGPTSWVNAAYWICSFANNQWNIGAELGSDPMESAFARTLTAGIKGVAMVLDQEVQPLTRVWCLFEFLLSSREHLELVFVTNVGVIGDDGCSSFDIALEVGKKIKSLQVATCGASSEKDKKDIFDYIISELGSLERMDDQIRKLMAQMLMRNLANVEKATGSLVDSLGQGSATDTDATLYEAPKLHPRVPKDATPGGAAHNSDCHVGRRLLLPVTKKCSTLQSAMSRLRKGEMHVHPSVFRLDCLIHSGALEGSHPVPQPGSGAGARRLQVIGWAELCERKKLTAGSCFQLQPTVAAPLCELQGPHGRHGAPAQLRPAAAGILTLTSGELRITGQIQMTSLRLAAKTVNFADAHVEAWHEGLSDPNSTESGGAFFSNGSFTLTRSHLTVRGAAAVSGGGFAADGDLILGGIVGSRCGH
ncbi:unnamed protein product, partial [Cladocopium goreaui]